MTARRRQARTTDFAVLIGNVHDLAVSRRARTPCGSARRGGRRSGRPGIDQWECVVPNGRNAAPIDDELGLP